MAFSVLKTAQARSQVVGQCKLIYVDATTLKLIPFNGNLIKIGGQVYQIPAAGITITNSGFAASTLYYIYLYNNSGTLTLTGNQGGHATSQVSGNVGTEVMTGAGNDGYTLVGMVNTGSDFKFYDQANLRWVRSWFNDYGVTGAAQTSANVSTSNTTTTELDVGARVYVLMWKGEHYAENVCATMWNNSVNYLGSLTCYINGAAAGIPTYLQGITSSPWEAGPCNTGGAAASDSVNIFSIAGYSQSGSTTTFGAKQVAVSTQRR